LVLPRQRLVDDDHAGRQLDAASGGHDQHRQPHARGAWLLHHLVQLGNRGHHQRGRRDMSGMMMAMLGSVSGLVSPLGAGSAPGDGLTGGGASSGQIRFNSDGSITYTTSSG